MGDNFYNCRCNFNTSFCFFIPELRSAPLETKVIYILFGIVIDIGLYIARKAFYTYHNIVKHHQFMGNFVENQIKPYIKNKIQMEQGEEQVIKFVERYRETTKGEFRGIWCKGYDEESLRNYFSAEKSLVDKNVHRVRLINTTSIREDRIRDHLKDNMHYIINGTYEVYSTTFENFELVICGRVIDGENSIVIQLFGDVANERVDLAIASDEQSFVYAMKKFFIFLKEKGIKLNAKNNEVFNNAVDEWIKTKPK